MKEIERERERDMERERENDHGLVIFEIRKGSSTTHTNY